MINFVCLGSVGTYGHLAMADQFARIAAALFPSTGVRLVAETQCIPEHLTLNFSDTVYVTARKHDCSRGGRLNAVYDGDDIDALCDLDPVGIWVFSTFYDRELVLRLRSGGATCIWMGNPMRLSFWNLFHMDGNAKLFDQVVVLDDVAPRIDALETGAGGCTPFALLPPPYYFPRNGVHPYPRTGSDETKYIVGVACGGGLINGSDELLIAAVQGLLCVHDVDLEIHVYSGQVDHGRLLSLSDICLESRPLTEGMPEMDLLVCQGGYHTVQESLYHALPCVYIPAPRLIDDQELRVVEASRMTGSPVLLPSELSRLPTVVGDLLAPGRRSLNSIRSNIVDAVGARGWLHSGPTLWRQFLESLLDRVAHRG